MKSQRRIERHLLPYYLKVFNRITDKPMGSIGNISLDGLMLISPYPMLTAARFEMRIKIPRTDGGIRKIDFSATCQWSHEDVTPGSFDSGFALVAPPRDYAELIESLRYYFSFYHHSAAA